MCIKHTPARDCATISTAPASSKPCTSLMMSAQPRSSAARITPARRVSKLTGTFQRASSAKIGCTRCHSASGGT